MGTIITRSRSNGTRGHTAQFRLKRLDKTAHSEARTFDSRPDAEKWLTQREAELSEPGALAAMLRSDPTLAAVITKYIAESRREMGRTALGALKAVQRDPIGNVRCSAIGSVDIVALSRRLPGQPQTVLNYLSHLSSVFAIARAAWGFPLDPQAMKDAILVAKRLGLVAKSKRRTRRPTLAELDAILAHFEERQRRRPSSSPMGPILAFALFSARRLDEITRITWADLDEAGCRILVRDMKNPGEKLGNHIWCDLPPEALRIVQAMPRDGERIFPFGPDAIGMAFTRAGQFLGIEDLHFHDLRHEGVSRLFEMGRTIPQVAAVSGHRSWQGLQRYAHVRQTGDKYAGWAWLGRLAPERPGSGAASAGAEVVVSFADRLAKRREAAHFLGHVP